MKTLVDRRRQLCLNFAKNCLKNEKVKGMFQKKKQIHVMKKRNNKEFEEKDPRTQRYKKSAIPYFTNLLNEEKREKRELLKH